MGRASIGIGDPWSGLGVALVRNTQWRLHPEVSDAGIDAMEFRLNLGGY